MKTVALVAVLAAVVPASAATSSDPVQEASDWQAVIVAGTRTGSVVDAKACGDCLENLEYLPACRAVSADNLVHTKKPEKACVDTCKIETTIEYDKIVERKRAEPKCRAELSDPAAIKRASEMVGEELTLAYFRCNACVTPTDLEKWAERRRALMQLHGRLGEALGKTDAASRAAALAPLFAEAKAQFACSGDKIEPASCLLRR